VGKTSACKGPGRGDRARDGVAGLALAVIRSDVLDADDARFRPAKLAPQPATDEVLSHSIDPPVEIVRREKGEVPSVVAVTLDDVVRMTRDVLLVPGEDDKVVTTRELVAARNRLEVVVGEEVNSAAGLVQPRDELEIPVVEAEGNAEVEERSAEVDASMLARDVPRVAPPVTVSVREVVRRPGIRREHDCDAMRAEPPRPDDERR